MLIRRGEHTELEARAKAEPADDVLTRDYYTLRPQIRLTADPTEHPTRPKPAIEITLDGNDIATLVECAIRHPNPTMRSVVLAAIWGGQWASQTPAVAKYFTLTAPGLAIAIMVYGFAASALPVWLLLAPRDYLSTFMKLGTILLLALGTFLLLPDLKMPAVSK